MNLYDLALNHNDIDHSHDIFIIKPTKAVNEKSAKEIKTKLESLSVRGFVKKDYFNKWSITQEGLDYVENYFEKEEM